MKKRLDVILVNGGYAASREKARALIMAGSGHGSRNPTYIPFADRYFHPNLGT